MISHKPVFNIYDFTNKRLELLSNSNLHKGDIMQLAGYSAMGRTVCSIQRVVGVSAILLVTTTGLLVSWAFGLTWQDWLYGLANV